MRLIERLKRWANPQPYITIAEQQRLRKLALQEPDLPACNWDADALAGHFSASIGEVEIRRDPGKIRSKSFDASALGATAFSGP